MVPSIEAIPAWCIEFPGSLLSPQKIILRPIPRQCPRTAPARTSGYRRFPAQGCRGRAGWRNLPGTRRAARRCRD